MGHLEANTVCCSGFSSERGREGRLIRLLSDTFTSGETLGTAYGFGVDEDTALVVSQPVDGSQGPTAEVLGRGGVFFADVGSGEVDTVNG